ncbi:hypothetical protein GCM10027072_15790 [Streptomyces bullii]
MEAVERGSADMKDLRTLRSAFTVRPRRTALVLDRVQGPLPDGRSHPSAPVTARGSAYREGLIAEAPRPPCGRVRRGPPHETRRDAPYRAWSAPGPVRMRRDRGALGLSG